MLLSVDGLSLNFGSHAAVRDLSFSIDRGETVALVGESGSGKSATALAIMRLIDREGGSITGGRILLDGTDLAVLPEREMRQVRGNRISMVFQEPMTALNPVMRLGDQVIEVLARHRHLSRMVARRAARDAFQRAGIPEAETRLDQFPHQLSGGLRQRVMIAMALACQPDLLIADEPTTALDVTTQAEILELVRDLQRELGMAVLFITHDMGVVAQTAERMVVLRHGCNVEEGPVRTVFAQPKADYTRRLMASTPRLGAGGPVPVLAREPVLSVSNLSVTFETSRFFRRPMTAFQAVRNVSFSVSAGETLGLVGESGCGKSTLARAILRLIKPSGGRVHLAGRDLGQLSPAELRRERRNAQMVFQDPFASLNPRLSVTDLITEPARIAGRIAPDGARALAIDLLEKVGLERDAADRYPHQFSGGQRQRLCIARALSAKPSLIIADEPVSALDVSVARQVTDLIAELQRDFRIAFLFISHDIAVVERVSHRIAVMQAGRIVETGPSASVLRHPAHPYTQQLLAAVPVPDPAIRPQKPPLSPTPAQPGTPSLLPDASSLEEMVEIGPGHFILMPSEAKLRMARPQPIVPPHPAEALHPVGLDKETAA
jgi:ABC-type glutathione transport system ATPase component